MPFGKGDPMKSALTHFSSIFSSFVTSSNLFHFLKVPSKTKVQV